MSEENGYTWVSPTRLGGIPCVRGTRVPVDLIRDLLCACPNEEIVEFYPTVTVDQVAAIRADSPW